MNILGKAFIISMNNRYTHFNVGDPTYAPSLSRVTYCGDDFGGNEAFEDGR
jgi:hypothetical protein